MAQNTPGKIGPRITSTAALILFASATVLGPGLQKEPFYSWYYSFAWWSYILAAESLLAGRRRSLLFQEPGRFFLLLPISICLWLVFEAFNFRLQNWHYLNLPAETWWRWIGYTISFATVVPGLRVTRELLDEAGLARNLRVKAYRLPGTPETWQALGLGMLVLPLLWPEFFFPLVWVGFIFLLDPVLARTGRPSLLTSMARGHWDEILQWLTAGLICGFMWELWNYWAGAKWYYTVPWVGGMRVFEMPLPGYLGFPPFALECLVMTRFALLALERWPRLPGSVQRVRGLLFGAAAALWICGMYYLLDELTVASLLP